MQEFRGRAQPRGSAPFSCARRTSKLSRVFGFLNVNKPPGPTSHDVVARARRLLPRSVKVGHCGTLDPFAEGVLVLCLGQATRLAEFISSRPKQYEAEVTLGVTSTTDDPEGRLTFTGLALPTAEQIQAVLPSFLGDISQTPPAHSAIQVGGRRAYRLARAGRDVNLASRIIRIDSLALLEYIGSRAILQMDCSSGTYVRAFARDLGRALGCGAYCSGLTRTLVGPFMLADSIDMDSLSGSLIKANLQPARLAVESWPTVVLSDEQEQAIGQGKVIQAQPGENAPAGVVAAVNAVGDLVALCELDCRLQNLRPVKVFVTSGSKPAGS